MTDRVISYLRTEFVCLTYKENGAKACAHPAARQDPNR